MNKDLKLFLIVMGAVLAVLALLYVGDEYDVPILKQLHDAVGG